VALSIGEPSTKCTLCVARIHDEHLPKEDRKPAFV